jgi:hypothetical protein
MHAFSSSKANKLTSEYAEIAEEAFPRFLSELGDL